MNTVFDLDKISPAPDHRSQGLEERRLRLALERVNNGRQPQQGVIRLINASEPKLLREISHNTRMQLLVGLRTDSPEDVVPTGAQLARMKIYANLDLGGPFQDQSRDLGQRVARRFIADQGGEPFDKRWARLDEDGRMDMVIEFLHAYGHESGLMPPGRVETKHMPPTAEGRIRHAEYDLSTDTILLNTHEDAGWEMPVHVLASSGHETAHKLQTDMGNLLLAEQRPDLVGLDPVEEPVFRDAEERQLAWYFFDNLRFGYIQAADNQIGYKHQPVEAHAYLVEGAVKQGLNRHLTLGADQGLITGVSNDDLSALGIDPDKLRTDAAANANGQPERRDRHLPKRGLH